jgi:phospholipid transport system substrate-binding protein
MEKPFAPLLLALGLVAALLARPAPAAAPDEGDPTATVARFQSELLAVWKADIGFRERFRRLEGPVKTTHDLPYMARFSLGSVWEDLSEEERSRFVDVFGRLMVARYAERFADYTGARFERTGSQELGARGYMVSTELVKSDGERIRLDYILNRREAGWRIANVLADGVSELAMQRSDFTEAARKWDIDRLIQGLEGRIEEMAEE